MPITIADLQAALTDRYRIVLLDCRSAQLVRWRVPGREQPPTVAAFVIRDAQGRVYPSQAKRRSCSTADRVPELARVTAAERREAR